MKITTKKTLEVTGALEIYIEEKLGSIGKMIASYEKDGDVELRVEVARTTQHHKKGDEVYFASADLRLPGKILRSEATASDIRKAIDEVRDMLHGEIEKYKTKHSHGR